MDDNLVMVQQMIKSTIMQEGGYSKGRFPNLKGEIFDCIICLEVVKEPKECEECGNLFCSKCIADWMEKNESCPNRCPGQKIGPMLAKALVKIYLDLDIECQKCAAMVKLGELQKHESKCGLPPCRFRDQCDGFQQAALKAAHPVCSQRCQLLQNLLDTGGDLKLMHQLLQHYSPTLALPNRQSVQTLSWNNKQCGMNVAFTAENTAIFLKEEPYVFRSVVSSVGFTSGRHYWEIHADQRTENELKIGVSSQNILDFNTAFCDHEFGFAFYGLAQLRHGSNVTGSSYGKRFKKKGILGVYLNMDRGTLSFSLNGSDMGEAYASEKLKKGPFYPAVALLHCAGCTIKGELSIPKIYENN